MSIPKIKNHSNISSIPFVFFFSIFQLQSQFPFIFSFLQNNLLFPILLPIDPANSQAILWSLVGHQKQWRLTPHWEFNADYSYSIGLNYLSITEWLVFSLSLSFYLSFFPFSFSFPFLYTSIQPVPASWTTHIHDLGTTSPINSQQTNQATYQSHTSFSNI